MTVLTKTITRIIECHGGRQVVVALDGESKRIGFREKGCHKTFWLPVMAVYSMAIRSDEPDKKTGR
jgi:hypothetical protein